MMDDSTQLISRFADAVKRLDGDEDLLREIAAITSADLPDVVEETEQALCAGDAPRAASNLHKLKGMLSTFEAAGIVAELQAILDLAKNKKIAVANLKFEQHRSGIDELVGEINSLAAA